MALLTMSSVGTVLPVLGQDQVLFLESDDRIYDTAYKKWTERWWQLWLSIPKPDNPAFDQNYSGDTIRKVECIMNQNDNSSVLFLFNPVPEMKKFNWSCDVPRGKALLIPILAGSMDRGDEASFGKSDDEMKGLARACNNNSKIDVILDGRKLDIKTEPKNRITTDKFNMTLPSNNVWEEIPGTYEAYADGYYAFIRPLPIGSHILDYNVVVRLIDCPVNLQGTLELIVK